MSPNVLASLVLQYHTDSSPDLDCNMYKHVRLTAQQLRLPFPATRHIHSMSSTQVWVERMSFHSMIKLKELSDNLIRATPDELQELQSCGLCSVTFVNPTVFERLIDSGYSCSRAASEAKLENLEASLIDVPKSDTNMTENNALGLVNTPPRRVHKGFSNTSHSNQFSTKQNDLGNPYMDSTSTDPLYTQHSQYIPTGDAIKPSSLLDRVSPRSGEQASRGASGGITMGQIDSDGNGPCPQKTTSEHTGTNFNGKRSYEQIEQTEAMPPPKKKQKAGSELSLHGGHTPSNQELRKALPTSSKSRKNPQVKPWDPSPYNVVTDPLGLSTTEVSEGQSSGATLEELVKDLKGQISALHSVIDSQRAKIESQIEEISSARAELEDERKALKNVEHKMQEQMSALQREAQDPFIVPSLLRAFLKISRANDVDKELESGESSGV